jgi:hypothetical protein
LGEQGKDNRHGASADPVLALTLVNKNQTIFLRMNYMGGERIQID